MKILVIDDESQLRNRFRQVLEAKGHEVHEASNAYEALNNTAMLDACDLVITDMRMPGGSGLEFLQGYYRHADDPVPVLVHSSSDNFKDRGTPMLYLPKDIPEFFTFAEFHSKSGSTDYLLDFVTRHCK